MLPDDPFICPPNHRIPEVTNLCARYRPLVTLALEQNLEAHERINLKDANPIDSTIMRPSGYRDFLEAGLTKKALAYSLESIR